jgi:hypothetical protein
MNKIKGDLYENYILGCLSNDTKLKECYLWNDFPEHHMLDYGFIHDYNVSRIKRKKHIRDIGTDIIALMSRKANKIAVWLTG